MALTDDDVWWRRERAARYLALSPKTLANMACAGRGPRCERFSGGKRGGSVRYRKEWLDDYVMSSGLGR
jgi:hypothetical protein